MAKSRRPHSVDIIVRHQVNPASSIHCGGCDRREIKSCDCFCADLDESFLDDDQDVQYCTLLHSCLLPSSDGVAIRHDDCVDGEVKR